MKTAVSIPDAILHKARDVARSEGVSLDDLCAKALHEYARRHAPDDLQARIDRINAICREVDTSLDDGFKALRDASLPREQW